jgi:hypothetical protein
MVYAVLLAAVTLTPGQVDSVISGAERAFHAYVFPDVARRAVALLEQRESGYRAIGDPKALAANVNADLLTVTHDKHVRLMYPFDPAMVEMGTPDDAEQARYEASENYFFKTVQRLPGNVGYLDFRQFSGEAGAARAVYSAMAFLADTNALIIDLRKNGGGDPRLAQTLEGYFFAEPQQITSLVVRDPKTGTTSEQQQYTAPNVPGALYLNKPVYLLTSRWTFSCAEQFTYDLHNLKRVTIVGETTGGGANPGGFEPLPDQFAIFIPNGRAYSPVTKTNWEGTGIAPDVATSANDALSSAYVLALQSIKRTDKSGRELREIDEARADPAKALESSLSEQR